MSEPNDIEIAARAYAKANLRPDLTREAAIAVAFAEGVGYGNDALYAAIAADHVIANMAEPPGLDEMLATIAGVPCRFCHGPGNADGPCPDCGKP